FGSAFMKKPTRMQLVAVAKNHEALLPDGCYVNYDLGFIGFLESLVTDRLELQYAKLKQSLKRRPSLAEFWQSGANLTMLRSNYGSWWEFLDEQGDANGLELQVLEKHAQWFRDLTITRLSKSYKLILLKTLLEQQRISSPVSLQDL